MHAARSTDSCEIRSRTFSCSWTCACKSRTRDATSSCRPQLAAFSRFRSSTPSLSRATSRVSSCTISYVCMCVCVYVYTYVYAYVYTCCVLINPPIPSSRCKHFVNLRPNTNVLQERGTQAPPLVNPLNNMVLKFMSHEKKTIVKSMASQCLDKSFITKRCN